MDEIHIDESEVTIPEPTLGTAIHVVDDHGQTELVILHADDYERMKPQLELAHALRDHGLL